MWQWTKRRRTLNRDLEREIRAHLELEAEERMESGTAPEDAPYAARRAFGNVTLIQEVTREMWGWTSLERLSQDLRYAGRMMRKSPGFTAVAVLSLTLGIGANTAIFSLVNAVMLRALPVQEPQRLVLFGKGRWVGISDGLPNRSWQLFSYPFYREVQRKNEVFSGVAAMESLPNSVSARVNGASGAERVEVRLVSGTYFSVLGVNPVLGRVFTDADDQTPGGHPVAVASYSWWKRRFGGDPSIAGRTLTIGPVVYTVVGVAPPEFFGTTVGQSPDVWIPLAMIGQVPPGWGGDKGLQDELFQSLYIMSRLRPGVTFEQAGANVNVIFQQALRQYAGPKPSVKQLDDIKHALIELTPGGRGLSQVRIQFSLSLQILMAAVGLVLLIACANIANLLLARAASRQKEIAVRLAIGAGRVRLIRQMLTESILLAAMGGVAGIAFAWWASELLLWMVSTGPETLPLHVAPDGRVLAFTLVLSLATGILFGAAPAFRATRVELSPSLREGRGSASGHSQSALAKTLIVSQVTLSIVLLIGAGLFVRSLANLRDVDTGFHTEGVLVLGLDTASIGYKEDAKLGELYQQIEQRVSSVPGVRSSSFSMFTFNEGEWSGPAYALGQTPPPENERDVQNNKVGPAFFTTMALPIVLGRALGPQDTEKSPKVAVINETMARRFFPNGSPIGRRFGEGEPEHSGDIEIVGVAKDAKYESLREKPQAAAYYPYTQSFGYLGNLEVRFSGDLRGIVPEIRRAIGEVNRDLPITEVRTLAEQVDGSLVAQKLIARLSSFFGGLALLLASIGIYGILSYAVSRRTSEVGLRMALGAKPSHVVWLVMRDVVALVAIGLAIGIPTAVALERLVSSMLFGVTNLDAVSIAAAVMVLVAVAGVAAYLPARRASLVDPMTALRYE
jgi:predicted permease